jgi:hypothetical protein
MQRKGAFRRAAVFVSDRLTIYACPSDAEALAVGHVIAGPTLTDRS